MSPDVQHINIVYCFLNQSVRPGSSYVLLQETFHFQAGVSIKIEVASRFESSNRLYEQGAVISLP